MKTAIYIRVSTQEQAEEGYSIGEQTDRLKKYCEAKDWNLIKVYTDPGFSGSNMNRPALKLLISEIDNFDMILVYKLDRLSRSQKDTLFLIEDVFLRNNVDFVSMNENFDTSTPFGRAMIGILSVFAQLEREQIKERMAMGHLGRAKKGYWRGGSGSPIGYDFKDGSLVINEYEALQIREIFNLFINGNTMNNITSIMKSKYTNRYSSWNNTSTIGKILRNSTYVGKLRYMGSEYEGQHEPIVTKEIFDLAQIRYDEIEKVMGKQQKSPYMGRHLLSGIMFCGNCGARYFTHCTMSKKNGTYHYYTCYSRDGNKQMKKMVGCKNPNYRMDKLDEIITNQILKLATDKKEIEKIYKKKAIKPSDKSSVIKNRITEIEKQTSKLIELYQIGTIPITEISNRIDPLQKEKTSLEETLLSLNEPIPALTIDNAYSVVLDAKEVFKSDNLESKRAIVNALIEKIVLDGEDIEITWKFC